MLQSTHSTCGLSGGPIPKDPKIGSQKYVLVEVSVPYIVEYVRRNHRKPDHGTFWEKGSVAIRSVADEVSTLCYIQSTVGARGYRVLSFDGAIWWPLFVRGEPVKVADYVADAMSNSGVFLTVMNLSPATLHSPRRDFEQFSRKVLPRKVDAPQRSERWRGAQALADRTIFFDGAVYFKGGYPVWFAVDEAGPFDEGLVFEVGSAGPEIEAIARYLPGPKPHLRRDAACRSLVYGMEELEAGMDRHRRRRIPVTRKSSIDAEVQVISSPHAAELCAKELANRAIKTMPLRSLNEISALLGGRQLRNQSALTISPSLALEIIDAMMGAGPTTNFEELYGVEFEWALQTRSRLDAISPRLEFSEADLDRLAELVA